MLSGLNGDLIGSIINSISMIQSGDIRSPVNDHYYEEEFPIRSHDLSNACQVKNSAACLSLDTIQRMLRRFLLEKKMPQKELAANLGLEIKELNLLFLKKASLKLVFKINLPLIKLYCSTRWTKNNT